MKRFLKFRYGQGGFTLIELLIVVAILGVLAAVIIPNAQGFMIAGTLNASNTELANAKTAGTGYMAEHGAWPDSPSDGDLHIWANGKLTPYLSGELKAYYSFGDDGSIDAALSTDAILLPDGGWGDKIEFDLDRQVWVRTGEAGTVAPIIP